MTTAEIAARIANALVTSDQLDLARLAEEIDRLPRLATMSHELGCWHALINAASDSIDGAFRDA